LCSLKDLNHSRSHSGCVCSRMPGDSGGLGDVGREGESAAHRDLAKSRWAGGVSGVLFLDDDVQNDDSGAPQTGLAGDVGRGGGNAEAPFPGDNLSFIAKERYNSHASWGHGLEPAEDSAARHLQ